MKKNLITNYLKKLKLKRMYKVNFNYPVFDKSLRIHAISINIPKTKVSGVSSTSWIFRIFTQHLDNFKLHTSSEHFKEILADSQWRRYAPAEPRKKVDVNFFF